VNAALHLRRPLLLTGPPGSGKSSLVELLAAELELGDVLRWHVTSRSILGETLFEYDALGRLHTTQVAKAVGGGAGDDMAVEHFVTLGALGTALSSTKHPRALLVDEIDKSDLDLPGDLLNVLERGEFAIPPLVRDATTRAAQTGEVPTYSVRGDDGGYYPVDGGVVHTRHFPVIIFTSNGERAFPPPFLRRCVQFSMPKPDADFLSTVVAAHLGEAAAEGQRELIQRFARQLAANKSLAVDQLLNIVYLTLGPAAAGSVDRAKLEELILTELSGR